MSRKRLCFCCSARQWEDSSGCWEAMKCSAVSPVWGGGGEEASSILTLIVDAVKKCLLARALSFWKQSPLGTLKSINTLVCKTLTDRQFFFVRKDSLHLLDIYQKPLLQLLCINHDIIISKLMNPERGWRYSASQLSRPHPAVNWPSPVLVPAVLSSPHVAILQQCSQAVEDSASVVQ